MLEKRWTPVGSPLKLLEKALEMLENQSEVLKKAVEKLFAEPLKKILFSENPLGNLKFTQAVLRVDS